MVSKGGNPSMRKKETGNWDQEPRGFRKEKPGLLVLGVKPQKKEMRGPGERRTIQKLTQVILKHMAEDPHKGVGRLYGQQKTILKEFSKNTQRLLTTNTTECQINNEVNLVTLGQDRKNKLG